jgi:hypothetical protein
MDYVVTANFSFHQTGVAAQLTGHSHAAVGGALPQQQPSLLAEQNNDSSSHVFVQHSPSCFVEAYEHKLSLLANANEDIVFWSKCFSLY